MAGSADFIQRMVHALEAGQFAVWLRRGLAALVVVGLAVFYLLHEFRGLATSEAMDQAQIGRNIAGGQGWRTDMIRPRAVGQLQARGKDVAQNIWYDTYHAPLPPLVDALALLPVKKRWKMTPRDVVYVGDRMIAIGSIALFLASLAVLYFTARRLFDERLALLAAALVLISDTIWQYSLSGLPQMLLLLLFNATFYVLVRALEAQYAGTETRIWLAATGAGFGLLALSHALTLWMFVPALAVIAWFFRPRWLGAAIVLGVFAIFYTPWLVRNYAVSGNPGGVAIYSILGGINHTEAGHMRRVDLDLAGVRPGHFRNKISANLMSQLGRIYEHLGWSIAAAMFFVSLLHPFRRPETAMLRWMLLAIWGGAVVGMSVYGINEEQGFAANQLHLLFIPLMTCYGLAYLLVQWNRLGIDLRLARIGFITLIFVLCGIPFLNTLLLAPAKPAIRWRPYVPPYISVLNDWMKPEEITASDMPWAIAWYADRRALWLPDTVKAFTEFNDYSVFRAPVNGLYLTPISGSENTLTDILKGEYKDWATVILRSLDLSKFPLKWATLALGLENEAVFFSDHDRQKASAP